MIKQIIRKMRVRRSRNRVNRINSNLEKLRSDDSFTHKYDRNGRIKLLNILIGNIKPK